MLVLWAEDDDLPTPLDGDVPGVWREWADDLRGHGLPPGCHLAEEVPRELARELRGFLEATG